MRKFQNFLLAMDHSLYAKRAARFLEELQLPAASNLYVLNVIDPPQQSVPSGIVSTPHWDKQLELLRSHMFKNARQFVKNVQNRFQGDTLKLHPVVSEGLAINEILLAIDQYKIDLAVVGHQGLTGIRRFLLGSVSEEVLNHASCSVLMVRTPPSWARSKQPRGMRVLVAADASFDSQAALAFLRWLTFPPGSSIEILHVLEPLSDSRMQFESERIIPNLSKLLKMEKHIWKRRESEGGNLLKNLQHKLKVGDRTTKTIKVLSKGYPADVIIKEAKHIQADLIIIGSRGLRGINRFLLGSVSRKVVRHAPCSVLVVKPSKRP